MSSNLVILQLVLLGVVLESDLGLRKIGWFRVGRPIIAIIAIVPSYLTALPTSGNNPLLQGLGLLAGAVIGSLSVSPIFVSVYRERSYRSHWTRLRKKPGVPAIVSRAGRGYALIWSTMAVARLAFAYGATHVFSDGLGHFLASNHLTSSGLTNALIFLSLGMDLFRSAGLVIRGRNAHRRLLGSRGPATSQTPQPAMVGQAQPVISAPTVAPENEHPRLEATGQAAQAVARSAAAVVASRTVGRHQDRVARRRDRSTRRDRRRSG